MFHAEAPQEAAIKSGLELLTCLSPLLIDWLDPVFAGAERAVTSASPGVVQAAARLLGALGTGHASRRDEAVRLLEECLQSSNLPSVEEALRALGKVLSSAGASPGGRTATARGAKTAKKNPRTLRAVPGFLSTSPHDESAG